jgi:hypothetical protein
MYPRELVYKSLGRIYVGQDSYQLPAIVNAVLAFGFHKRLEISR